MTHEQLEKAKEIEKRIKNLLESIISIDTYKNKSRPTRKGIKVSFWGYTIEGEYSINGEYGTNKDSTLSFLEEYMADELLHLIDMIESKVKKEVSKLEKELLSI